MVVNLKVSKASTFGERGHIPLTPYGQQAGHMCFATDYCYMHKQADVTPLSKFLPHTPVLCVLIGLCKLLCTM